MWNNNNLVTLTMNNLEYVRGDISVRASPPLSRPSALAPPAPPHAALWETASHCSGDGGPSPPQVDPAPTASCDLGDLTSNC